MRKGRGEYIWIPIHISPPEHGQFYNVRYTDKTEDVLEFDGSWYTTSGEIQLKNVSHWKLRVR